MTAGAFLDVCRFTAASSGTGDFVVSSAVTGYQTPASAGAVNATVYSYRAESSDLSEWEIGYGAYTSGSTTLARTTVVSSSTGSKVSFTAAPQVAVTALTGDLLAKGNNLSDLPSASTAFGNIKQAATASATGVVKRQRVAIIREEQSSGTAGGTFTSGADRIRVLNTEVSDLDGIVSVASNQFTLQAGTWLIEWSAPAYKVDQHQSFLYNVTDTSVVTRGSSVLATQANNVFTESTGYTIVTIAGAKAFEIRHRCTTTQATNGLGDPASFGTEVYTQVKITSYDQ